MRDVGQKVSGYACQCIIMYYYVSKLQLYCQGSWEKNIIERLHNVKASQRKRHLSDSSTPKAKRGRPKQQSLLLTRYPPLTDTASDDVVTSRDIDALHKELEKSNTQKENIH